MEATTSNSSYIKTEGDFTFTRESTSPWIDYSLISKGLSNEQSINLTKPTMEKQIKVAVFLTEIENNEIISSTFLTEGWIRLPHNHSNLNLLAVKEFNLSLNDLDKIFVKQIHSITF